MQRTGEVDEFDEAIGWSFPRGDSDTPTTVIERLTAFSASYARASTRWYELHARGMPLGPYCGCQNRGWFGSLPTAKSCTCG